MWVFVPGAENTQPEDSVRRLWCPVHGARTEGVPFARPHSEFTRGFERLVVRHEAPIDRVGCRAPPPDCRSSSVPVRLEPARTLVDLGRDVALDCR